MFEGMLHAVLETLRGEHATTTQLKGGNFPDVYSVSPKRVFNFWSEQAAKTDVGIALGGASKTEGTTDQPKVAKKAVGGKTKAQKALKIRIVEEWLRPHTSDTSAAVKWSSRLECADDIVDVRDAFQDKLSKQKGRAGSRLADSREKKTKKQDTSLPVPLDLAAESSRKTDPVVAAVVEKADDLADCLLQGVTWVQWEVNRCVILDSIDLDGSAAPDLEIVGKKDVGTKMRRTGRVRAVKNDEATDNIRKSSHRKKASKKT